MLEADADCFDFLRQVSAVIGALRSLSETVMEEHLKNCFKVSRLNGEDSDRLAEQLIQIFKRFGK